MEPNDKNTNRKIKNEIKISNKSQYETSSSSEESSSSSSENTDSEEISKNSLNKNDKKITQEISLLDLDCKANFLILILYYV